MHYDIYQLKQSPMVGAMERIPPRRMRWTTPPEGGRQQQLLLLLLLLLLWQQQQQRQYRHVMCYSLPQRPCRSTQAS